MTTAKTRALTVNLRKDKVLSVLIPPTLCQSQPVPLTRNGIPCLGYYFYSVVGRESNHSLLSAPLYRVVIDKQTGRVIEAVNGLNFLPANTDVKKPVARFPGKGLVGKNVEEQNVLFNQYYELCDKLLDSQSNAPLEQSPVYPEWKQAFETVMEDGLEEWYNRFLGNNALNDGAPSNSNVDRPHNELTIKKAEQTNVQKPQKQTAVVSSAVKNVTLPIQQYLSSVEDLVKRSQCSNLDKQLQTVRQMRMRNDFRIAVIGEFSRGKSNFLNKLLETKLLPIGTLPTTALITQIENGPEATLYYLLPGHSPQKLPATPESFKEFIADEKGNDPSGVLKLQLPIDWFHGNKISLFDTPGANDLFGKRAELTLEAIQTCDAVIMAIDASSPCSMTEMAFLHDNVILKATPKISVLITKLDNIESDEQAALVKHIQNKIHSETSSAKFWTILEPPALSAQAEPMFDAVGIPAIRKAVASIVNDDDLLRLRSIHAVTMLKDIAVQAQQFVSVQLNMLSATKEQKLAKLEDVKRQQNAKSLLWEKLQLTVEHARIDAYSHISNLLRTQQCKLLDELTFQVDKSNAPKEWLDKDFPFSLRRSIENLSVILDKEILQQLGSCQQKLILEANNQLSTAVESFDFANFMLGDIDTHSSALQPEITDLSRYQQISRVALMGLTPLVCVCLGPAGPIGALVTGSASLIAGNALKKQVQEQKMQIKAWLRSSLDEIFNKQLDVIKNHLQDGFEKILQNVQAAAQKWLETQQSAYEQACEKVNNDSPTEPLDNLIAESKQLVQKMEAYINPEK